MRLLYESVQFPIIAIDGTILSTAYCYPNKVFRLFKRKPHVARMVRHVNVFYVLSPEQDDSFSTALFVRDFAKLCRKVTSVTIRQSQIHLVSEDVVSLIAKHGKLRSLRVYQSPSFDEYGFRELWSRACHLSTLSHVQVVGSGISTTLQNGLNLTRQGLHGLEPSFALRSYVAPEGIWPRPFADADHELSTWILGRSRESLESLSWTWFYADTCLATFPQLVELDLAFNLSMVPVPVDTVIKYLAAHPRLKRLRLRSQLTWLAVDWTEELLSRLPRTIEFLDVSELAVRVSFELLARVGQRQLACLVLKDSSDRDAVLFVAQDPKFSIASVCASQ